MSASWELQKAIYAVLSADAGLTTLLGGAKIYDAAPQSAAFPYVTLGQTTARDWSTGTEEGREHLVTFHVWSRAAGTKETWDIIDAVAAALEATPPTPAGHTLVNLRFVFSDARRDPDGETVHGILRYRAVTEEIQ